MDLVTLGRTGITVNKNGFGALPIQRIPQSEAVALVHRALDGGVTFFDTARVYSDSEEKLGAALRGVRNQVYIATKTPAVTAEAFWKDLHESLRQLHTDHVDLFQFHNPAFCPEPGENSGLYEAMLQARREGKIRYIGITNHRMAVARTAVASGLYDTLQYPFCYLASDDDLQIRSAAEEAGMGFLAMKGLSGGLITNARAAYAFLRGFQNVLPIWGVQRMWELEQFLACQEDPPEMDAEMKAVIEKDRAELVGNFCRSCGYCMPCPAGIEILNCARMSQLIRRAPSEGYLSPQWRKKMAKIESCMHCGRCRSRCPYSLPVPELLQKNYEDYKALCRAHDEAQ